MNLCKFFEGPLFSTGLGILIHLLGWLAGATTDEPTATLLECLLRYCESHVCMHVIRKRYLSFDELNQNNKTTIMSTKRKQVVKPTAIFFCVTIVLSLLSGSKSTRPLYVYNDLCNFLTLWKFETITFVIPYDFILILVVSFVGHRSSSSM
jgi:hypothetical protein